LDINVGLGRDQKPYLARPVAETETSPCSNVSESKTIEKWSRVRFESKTELEYYNPSIDKGIVRCEFSGGSPRRRVMKREFASLETPIKPGEVTACMRGETKELSEAC